MVHGKAEQRAKAKASLPPRGDKVEQRLKFQPPPEPDERDATLSRIAAKLAKLSIEQLHAVERIIPTAAHLDPNGTARTARGDTLRKRQSALCQDVPTNSPPTNAIKGDNQNHEAKLRAETASPTNREPHAVNTPDIRTLALSGIVIEPAVQVRVATRWATVKEYQEAMKAGAVFQAVTVTPIDDADLSKGFVLLDGHHRFHATAALGLTSINAEVVYGLPREGWRWAGVQRNRTHGLRYTMVERREQFRAYIEAGNHRIGKRGIKSARQMANELGGIVSDRRLPDWMKQDFPSIYRMMIARKMIAQPTANFGRKDMDPELAQIAASNLDQFMAAFRGIKSDDLRATIAGNIMGVAQMAAKAAGGGPTLPPVEIPEDEF